MCTISVLPCSALVGSPGVDRAWLRLVCSRDEQRTRSEAAPPRVHAIADRRVAMPLDPDGGGSWIAVNDRAMVFAVLNANPTPAVSLPARAAAQSRGLVIPAVAGADSMNEAIQRALLLDATAFRPFRLLMVDRFQLIECWPEEGRMRYRRSFLQGPMMRTSSGLGDALVQGPRRTLFRRFFTRHRDLRAAQDAFHDHQWPGQEHLSVRMERPDARTVSTTVVEMRNDVATMTYQSMASDTRHRLALPLVIDPGLSVACS